MRLVVAALVLLVTSGAARASIVYGSGGPNDRELFTINPAVPSSETELGSATVLPMNTYDLAYSVTSGLYALAGGSPPDSLYTVKTTGVPSSTLVHQITGLVNGDNLNALGFSNNGATLYAAGNSDLYTINTTTGAATQIVTTGATFTSSGDVSFDAGSNNLYITSTGGTGGDDQLLDINLTTKVVSSVTSDLGFANVYGLAFLNGVMYGLTDSGTSRILTINLITGAHTLIGTYATGFTGTAVDPTPEPPTLFLLGVGLLLFGRMRRRANRSGLVAHR